MLKKIAADLHEAGFTRTAEDPHHDAARLAGYTEDANGGTLEREDDPPKGRAHLGEWVSPISWDEPEQWARTKETIAIIVQRRCAMENGKERGAALSERTATHIHISVSDYGDNLAAYTNLVRFSHKYEDVLYRMGSRPRTTRDPGILVEWPAHSSVGLRPVGTQPMLRPLGYRLPNRQLKKQYERVLDFINHQTLSRNHAINFERIPRESKEAGHVEFRIPDATLQVEILQALINLYLHIVDAALVAALQGKTLGGDRKEPIGTHCDLSGSGALPDDLKAFLADTASFREMLDELALRNIDKASMTALFAITQWLPRPFEDELEAQANMAGRSNNGSDVHSGRPA